MARQERLWADGAYAGDLVDWERARAGRTLEIVERPNETRGFVPLPNRWTVARTFAWLGKRLR